MSNFKTGGLDANVTSVFPNYDFNEEKFASSSFDDNDWSTTDFPNSFALIFSRQQIDGAVWFRKKINFTEKPKEDYLFEVLDGIDDVDFLYVNGQLVGSTDCFHCPRRYIIPKEYMKKENILKKNCFDLLQITFLLQTHSTSIEFIITVLGVMPQSE